MSTQSRTFTDMGEAFPTVPLSCTTDLNIATNGAEFGVRWYDLGDGYPSPKLEAFCDSWAWLAESGIMDLLVSHNTGVDETPIQPDEFKAGLIKMGFVDDTDKHRRRGEAVTQ